MREIFGARDVDAPPTSPSPKLDEVIVALLNMTRQPTKHLLKKDSGVPSPKPRELDPMVLDAPGKGEGIQGEIGGARKTVVDWIRGKARQGNVAWASVGNVQQQLQGMGNHDHQVEEKQDDWAIHIFLEHRKEADAWAENETRGLVEEWESKVDLDWCDATGICGFGDGSCRAIGCG